MEIQDKPVIKKIQNIKSDDISTEVQHTKVYRELVEHLDRLMIIEQSQRGLYESVKDELVTSGRITYLLQKGDPKDDELLRYMKQIQQIKRLVIES